MPQVAKRVLPEKSQPALERSFILEYLQSKGYRMSDLRNLPKPKAGNLMKEACSYAALKLAEIEARSKFIHNIKGPD